MEDETIVPDESGEDTQSSDDSSSSQQDGKMIPEQRFNQVYGKMKVLEREISTLKEGKREGNLSEEQTKELQAKEYLKGLLKETLEEEKSHQSKAQKEELEKFQDEVNDVLSIHTDIKKQDFLEFLEKDGDDYSSIPSAMKGYKRLLEKENTGAEKAKQNLSKKPSLPSSEGSGGAPTLHEGDKNKSMWQIAQEAAAEYTRKK